MCKCSPRAWARDCSAGYARALGSLSHGLSFRAARARTRLRARERDPRPATRIALPRTAPRGRSNTRGGQRRTRCRACPVPSAAAVCRPGWAPQARAYSQNHGGRRSRFPSRANPPRDKQRRRLGPPRKLLDDLSPLKAEAAETLPRAVGAEADWALHPAGSHARNLPVVTFRGVSRVVSIVSRPAAGRRLALVSTPPSLGYTRVRSVRRVPCVCVSVAQRGGLSIAARLRATEAPASSRRECAWLGHLRRDIDPRTQGGAGGGGAARPSGAAGAAERGEQPPPEEEEARAGME